MTSPIPAPTTRSSPNRRYVAAIAVALVALASALTGTLMARMELARILEDKSYDLCFRLRAMLPAALAPKQTPAPITLVWIDAPTADFLQGKPRMLWPRYFGEAIRAAAESGAKAIGLDYYFSYPITNWDPSGDMEFFKAYSDATQQGVPVVLAYEAEEKRRESESHVPVYMLAMSQENAAYAELASDTDGFVRRVEWMTAPHGNEPPMLSFSLRIAAGFLGSNPAAHIPVAGDMPEDARQMLIHYYGPTDTTFPSVSMADVLRAARQNDKTSLRKWFQGRVALIGPDDLPDRHPTPFYLATRGPSQMMTGAEIHAHAISTIVNGDFLRPATAVEQWTLLLCAAFAAALVGFAIRWPQGLLATLALAAAAFALVVVAQAHGTVLHIVDPEAAIVLATVGSYGARLLTGDRRRALLEKSLTDMVSAEVLKTVIDAGGLPLDGELREVTVMFTDLRGFTHYSQSRDPQSVVRELNEYFSVMTPCVLRHGGMVNKYIGDGMLVLFGAPVPHPDHARRAVTCAQEMVAQMAGLNERRRAAGLEPWRIGVGIHTGEVVVGFVGARDKKMEYTANGDAVNVASRIEGLNKDYGTQILLSEATRERMGPDIATIWKGSQALKGREGTQDHFYTV